VADNRFDLRVLGGGSGGYAAALRAAELGRSVVRVAGEGRLTGPKTVQVGADG
jgi:pyruvate/2-oxoglutarate dehydrogenase complex dihydrolipoamide dehydrogenase (E3) component